MISEERGRGKTEFLAGLVRAAVDDAYVDAVHVRSQRSMTLRQIFHHLRTLMIITSP
jgi:hypothetical protein